MPDLYVNWEIKNFRGKHRISHKHTGFADNKEPQSRLAVWNSCRLWLQNFEILISHWIHDNVNQRNFLRRLSYSIFLNSNTYVFDSRRWFISSVQNSWVKLFVCMCLELDKPRTSSLEVIMDRLAILPNTQIEGMSTPFSSSLHLAKSVSYFSDAVLARFSEILFQI